MTIASTFNINADIQEILERSQSYTHKELVTELESLGWTTQMYRQRPFLFSPEGQGVPSVIKFMNKGGESGIAFADAEFARYCQQDNFAADSPNIVKTPHIGSLKDCHFMVMEKLKNLERDKNFDAVYKMLDAAYTGYVLSNGSLTVIGWKERKEYFNALRQEHPHILEAFQKIQHHAVQQFYHNRYSSHQCVTPRLDLNRNNIKIRETSNGDTEFVFIDMFHQGSTTELSEETIKILELFEIDLDEIRATPDPLTLISSENKFPALT